MRNCGGPCRGRERETTEEAIPFKQSWEPQQILEVVLNGAEGMRVEGAHSLPELIRDAGFAPAASDALGHALLEDLRASAPRCSRPA